MEDYRKLRVWQHAHRLTLKIYRLATAFPDFEQFGLAAQVRGAASSIGSNIAEGCGRRDRGAGNAELIRFLHMSVSSAMELDYRLLLAHEVGYLTDAEHQATEAELHSLLRMLARFISRLRELDRFRRGKKRSNAQDPNKPAS